MEGEAFSNTLNLFSLKENQRNVSIDQKASEVQMEIFFLHILSQILQR